eukprot:2309803-Pyramimonas_sp.AAC.1
MARRSMAAFLACDMLFCMRAAAICTWPQRIHPGAQRIHPDAQRIDPDAQRIHPDAQRIHPDAHSSPGDAVMARARYTLGVG